MLCYLPSETHTLTITQVMAQVTILHKEIKDVATKTVMTDYNLPVGDKEATKNVVKKLLESDKYIFANPKGV